MVSKLCEGLDSPLKPNACCAQMPAMPDSLQLRKILLQSDLLKKINELQQLDQLLMGNSLEYGVIGGQEPAVFGSYETLPSLTAHRSTPLPGNPFDLASLQREQPLTPLPLNTKRLSRFGCPSIT